MLATATGERWLLAARGDVADLVAGIYDFDRVVVTPLRVRTAPAPGPAATPAPVTLDLHVPGLGLEVHLVAGRGWPVPAPRRRPPWFTRAVEAPVARRLLGVEAYGVSPTGVREWYQASRWRPVVRAWASVDGADLGSLRPLRPAVGFGFSEPPRRLSLVEVTTVLDRLPRSPLPRSRRRGQG